MGLSGLDSKKCQTILQYKSCLSDNFSSIISIEKADSNKKVDEYGEIAVRKLTVQRKEFTSDDIKVMVEAYRMGETTYQLAEQFGCCKATISKILKEHGVNVTRCKAMSKLDDNVVVAMYEEMHTTEEIAKHFKVHPQAITKCLRNHNVKLRSRWDYYAK